MALHEAGFDAWSVWTGGEGGNIKKSKHHYWTPYIHEGTPQETKSRTREGFGPDLYTRFLIDFMRRHRKEPMLLYYPMCLTHTPFVTTPDARDASGREACFKAMVRYMDKLVGRLTDALKKQGLREETIIFFTTDNDTSRVRFDLSSTFACVSDPGFLRQDESCSANTGFLRVP